jgi:hypothetical protein
MCVRVTILSYQLQTHEGGKNNQNLLTRGITSLFGFGVGDYPIEYHL